MTRKHAFTYNMGRVVLFVLPSNQKI